MLSFLNSFVLKIPEKNHCIISSREKKILLNCQASNGVCVPFVGSKMLLGSYGPNVNVFVVSTDQDTLSALIEHYGQDLITKHLRVSVLI